MLSTTHTQCHQQALSDSQRLLRLISASVEAQGWGPLSSTSSAPGSPPVGVVQQEAVSPSLSPGPCEGLYAVRYHPTYPADRPMGQRSEVQSSHSQWNSGLYCVPETTVTASEHLPLLSGVDLYTDLLGGNSNGVRPLIRRSAAATAAGAATARRSHMSFMPMLWDSDLVVCGNSGSSSSSGSESGGMDLDPDATLDPDPGTTLDGRQWQQQVEAGRTAAAAAAGAYALDWEV